MPPPLLLSSCCGPVREPFITRGTPPLMKLSACMLPYLAVSANLCAVFLLACKPLRMLALYVGLPLASAQDEAKETHTTEVLLTRAPLEEVLAAKKEEEEQRKLKASLSRHMNNKSIDPWEDL